jgi:trigger factor
LKVDIETPADWSRRLKITVPAERVQSERRSVASQISKRVKLPGFRKGKVPASVLEKQYGPSIEQQTVERVVQSAYREALKEQGFTPISEASVDNVSYEPGSDLTFDVEFDVRPEPELSRLGGFTVKAPSAAVEEADVERVIDRLREQHATWNPVEGEQPVEGDRVHVEITPMSAEAGEPAPEARTYEVVVGSGEILESIDQSIRTLSPGEEGEFTVELPEPAEGAEAHRIRLKLVDVERPELPAADDAFARELGEFESLDSLRERIRTDLVAEAERESDREVRRMLMQEVLEANPFQVPPSLVEQYLDSLIQAPEDADPAEVAQAKEQGRPAAEYGVRRMLVIDRIAELESLHPTQEDVDERVREIAEQNGLEPAQVRQELARSGRIQAMASDLAEKRVFDYLKSLSTIIKEGE